ncbi:MAG: dienelactone hydrolase [Planctomycetota bacterium]
MRILMALGAVACHWITSPTPGHAYNPLDVASSSGQVLLLDVKDARRDRAIPVKVYLPEQRDPAPIVLFSHGLGGSRNGCAYLGEHWSARGYVAVFTQHHGSDEAVWKDTPRLLRFRAMRNAASIENARARFADIPAVIDQLLRWNSDPDSQLHKRLRPDRIGMSGHSFGAVTTQWVSGQTAPGVRMQTTEARIAAAIMFSPSKPQRGDAKAAFQTVSIPWMLMTGTRDHSPIGNSSVKDRLTVYPALPETISKYEVVLHDAEHSAFSQGTEALAQGDRNKRQNRNPNHHRVILGLSTAFWDAHLLDDAEAASWLQGTGAVGLMEPLDRWQKHIPIVKAGDQ